MILHGEKEMTETLLRSLKNSGVIRPLVVDVGGNKGHWSKIVTHWWNHNVIDKSFDLHIYEPTPVLCSYLSIEMVAEPHVLHQKAVSDSVASNVPFVVFEGTANELSTFKPFDVYLSQSNVKTVEVSTTTIDNDFPSKHIHVLKIDVEGAELMVLNGCENHLRDGAIDFIQVEYGVTYKPYGITFFEVMSYMAQYGYYAHKYMAGRFQKVDPSSFNEDYHMENYIFTKHSIGTYVFTTNWIGKTVSNTEFLPHNKFNSILEIGCFEGQSTVYFAHRLLSEGGRITCVDPLQDFYTEYSTKELNDMFVGQFDRFCNNTQHLPVSLIRKKSRLAWPLLQNAKYDFIYIDGDHSEAEVYNDTINAMRLLSPDGYILFDDYVGYDDGTTKGINNGLADCGVPYTVIKTDYQLVIQVK